MFGRRSRILALAFALSAVCRAGGQATPYVPNLDPAYRDIDGLIAAGWIEAPAATQRPYSRLTFARLIVNARQLVNAGPPLRQRRFMEALVRLERVFRREIHALCATESSPCEALPNEVTLRATTADATWTNSGSRAIPTSYGPSGARYIDAALNPIAQNNEGRVIVDGTTTGAEVAVDGTLGHYFAAAIHPRVWSYVPVGASAGGGATLQEGYVRALAGNFSAEVGRNHIMDGYARDGGPILSDNPRGLDMVRLSLDHPGRLPWFLRAIGPINASAMLASMGNKSDTPNSKLVVFTGDLHPLPILELGATILNHFGGDGLPSVSFRRRLEDIFLILPQGGVSSDKGIGASARISVPSWRSQFYADVFTTDDHHLFKYADQSLRQEAVWTGGAKTVGLGPDGRTDIWIEGSWSGVRPYTHHELTSGLTVDNRIIGSAMGPLAAGTAFGIDWRGQSSSISLSGAVERYAGADHYENQNPASDDIVWIRTVDRPDEQRARVLGEWRIDGGANRIATAVRVGYEHVTRWNFSSLSRSSVLAQLRLEYRP